MNDVEGDGLTFNRENVMDGEIDDIGVKVGEGVGIAVIEEGVVADGEEENIGLIHGDGDNGAEVDDAAVRVGVGEEDCNDADDGVMEKEDVSNGVAKLDWDGVIDGE